MKNEEVMHLLIEYSLPKKGYEKYFTVGREFARRISEAIIETVLKIFTSKLYEGSLGFNFSNGKGYEYKI